MKKISLLLTLLLIVNAVLAQKMPLCNAFLQLSEMADKDFAPIKLRQDTSAKSIGKVFHSEIVVTEALKSEVAEMLGKTTFKADFGIFETKEAARAKVSDLTKVMQSCYSTFKFHESNQGILNDTYFQIANYADDAFRLYNASFIIRERGKKFTVAFEFTGPDKSSFGDKINSLSSTDFRFVSQKYDTQPFSNALRRLLQEAKTSFSNIKGAETKSPNLYFKAYTPTFIVPGYNNSYIEDRSMGILYYIIPIVRGGAGQDFQKANGELMMKIMNALGQDYAYALSYDRKKINFVHKDMPAKNLLSIVVGDPSSGTFDLSIYIDAQKP